MVDHERPVASVTSWPRSRAEVIGVGDALVDRLVLVQDRAVDVERDEPGLAGGRRLRHPLAHRVTGSSTSRPPR